MKPRMIYPLIRCIRNAALACFFLAVLHVPASAQTPRPRLNLTGFVQADGAITTLRGGDIVEPYFAVQALLLAEEYGLDAAAETGRWLAWLAPRQRLDGTFARFCRDGMAWVSCGHADADDALLAMWMKLLRAGGAGLPPDLLKLNLQRSETALERLYDRSRGVYRVSLAYPYNLFMDNLEVWWYRASQPGLASQAKARRLQRAIHDVFWHPGYRRFLVSTPAEQAATAFYPAAVAQIYPLLFGYPALPAPAPTYYRQWMGAHRATWLEQGPRDFAWGVVALIALRQQDPESARCWLRETAHLRHSPHWTVSDEVVRQILEARGLDPAPAPSSCR